ncbi:MAG: 1-acyl-sn-glycerol-3-phosphate acyltransferase [Pedobacter sp.]|nr:MAG: 1-acyl-sn-glycerol-3-phosphate acyltransferase [Pedobacter sp.]
MSKILSGLFLLYAALIFIILMIIALPCVLIVTTAFNPVTGKRIGLTILRCWAWAFSILSCFFVRTENASLIDTSKAHIYVSNHGSYLDAVAVCISVPQSFSALGKVEMAKTPIFGWIYERMVIMINRSSKESRDQSVITLKKEIASGQSILIFPEGTMNKTEQALSEFYDGAFRIAIETGTSIQPFVIQNNRNLLPRINPLSAKPGLMKTIFLPKVEVKGYTLSEIEVLKKTVHMMMEDALKFRE